jgi:hypothetical protein
VSSLPGNIVAAEQSTARRISAGTCCVNIFQHPKKLSMLELLWKNLLDSPSYKGRSHLLSSMVELSWKHSTGAGPRGHHGKYHVQSLGRVRLWHPLWFSSTRVITKHAAVQQTHVSKTCCCIKETCDSTLVCSTGLALSFRRSKAWAASRAIIQVMSTHAVANSTEVPALPMPWKAVQRAF